jgi:hypothetical protein
LGWCFAKKALTRTAHVFRKVKLHLTRRCSTVPLRSTGQVLSCIFVVLLRKSIPQKYNLKPAAELNVTLGKKLKAAVTGKSQKQKLCSESSVVFRFKLEASFHVVA